MVARGLLCGFYVVAMVPGWFAKVVAMQLLGYSGVVGRVPGVVAKVFCYAVARVPRWLPRCCYAVCYGTWGGC